jgi:hypothetical protein
MTGEFVCSNIIYRIGKRSLPPTKIEKKLVQELCS